MEAVEVVAVTVEAEQRQPNSKRERERERARQQVCKPIANHLLCWGVGWGGVG